MPSGYAQGIAAGGPGVDYLKRIGNFHWIQNNDRASPGQSGLAYYNIGDAGEIVGLYAGSNTNPIPWMNDPQKPMFIDNMGPEMTPKRFNTICYILSKTYKIADNPMCAVYYWNNGRSFVGARYRVGIRGYGAPPQPAHLQLWNDIAYYDDDLGYYGEDEQFEYADNDRKQFQFAAYDEDEPEYSDNARQQMHFAEHANKHSGYNEYNYADNGYESPSGGAQWMLMIVVAALLFVMCCIGLCVCTAVGAGLGYFAYQQVAIEDQKGYIEVERVE